MLILNVVYVLIAIAMIVLILMQRGAGAQAGSGFGSGASATVFGARGASNFMSKATKWLAILFFGISLYMAWYAQHSAKPVTASQQDAGLMGEVSTKQGEKAPPAPVPSVVPPAPSTVPAAPTQALPVPAAPGSQTPAPQGATPAKPTQSMPAQPAPPQGG